MAVNRKVNAVSYPAGGDLSASQYCIVYMSDEGRVTVNGAGGATACLGILLNKPTAVDQAARVAIDGSIVKCIAGGAVAERAWVMAAASGHGTSATTDNGYCVGRAHSAAAASATLFEVLVDTGRY